MKIAVVGTGQWGKNHVRTLAELRNANELDDVVICDADGSKARTLADEFDVGLETDVARVAASDVDGVVIATPSPTHYELARRFMEAGIDVLVEKPLALNTKEAALLVERAQRQKRVLMVGHEFRFHPGIRHLKRMLDDESLGTPRCILANRFDYRTPRTDMGVLYALAIHDVDLFCYLLDQPYPRQILAQTIRPNNLQVEVHATVHASFESGVAATAVESWITPAYGKTRELVFVGEKASARVDFLRHDGIDIFDGTHKKTVSFSPQEPLKEELRHFLACIQNRKTPVADGEAGLRAVAMIEACLKSARDGRAVPL